MITKRADIKIGFKCNNYCRHCVQGGKREKFGNKSLLQLRKELKSARQTCEEIVLTGGEPTLHNDFFAVVRYAKELGFKSINLQTNGRRFYYKDFCRQCLQAGVTSFVFGIAGHIPALHDYITTSPGSFLQLIQGVRNLKSLGQYIAVNSVVSKPNFRHLPQMADLFVRIGIDQYQFAFVHPMGNAKKNFYSIVPRLSIIEPFIKRGLEKGIRAGKLVMTEAIPFCFMQGYEQYVVEQRIPDTKIYDANNIVNDYTYVRQNEGKLKGPVCKHCRCNSGCEGPWREYPEGYGWSEFKALK